MMNQRLLIVKQIKAHNMNDTKKWFAVYTRPRTEKKVSETFNRKKIENYTPLNRVGKKWGDRRKSAHEPLFSSYVFVRVTEQELSTLPQIDGVLSIVYWLNKPAVIKDSEINAIKRFLSENANVKVEKTPMYVNDNVRVIGGALMDYEGQVLSVRNKNVQILISSLGCLLYADIETSNIDIVNKPLLIKPINEVVSLKKAR